MPHSVLQLLDAQERASNAVAEVVDAAANVVVLALSKV